jgi:hypothetical protein
MRSAPLFQLMMTPSSVLLTMASSADSTMAASRACASSDCLRGVMSRATFEAPTMRPSASLMGETVSEMSTSEPSLRTRTVS